MSTASQGRSVVPRVTGVAAAVVLAAAVGAGGVTVLGHTSSTTASSTTSSTTSSTASSTASTGTSAGSVSTTTAAPQTVTSGS